MGKFSGKILGDESGRAMAEQENGGNTDGYSGRHIDAVTF